MTESTFYVDKNTDTFADSLAAFGLADVLWQIGERVERGKSNVRIIDDGPYFRVTIETSLDEATLKKIGFHFVFDYIGHPLPSVFRCYEHFIYANDIAGKSAFNSRCSVITGLALKIANHFFAIAIGMRS